MVTILTLIIVAYLIGAIPFGLIIARMCGVTDIRREGSGNIGATNVFRVAGFKAAIWVYVLDIGKGVGMVLLARSLDQSLLQRDLFLVLVALAAILGHVMPVYLKFRGGKGVNTALGCLLVLLPKETAAALAAFAVIALLTRYVSLGSIGAAVALAMVLLGERFVLRQPVADVYLYLGPALVALVLITHRGNIRRLLAGTESRLSFSSRARKAGSHV